MIREARLGEVRKVTEFMTDFEKETEFVKVHVDHTVQQYEEMIRSGRAAMFIIEDDDGNMQGGLGCVLGSDLHYPRMIAVETYWYIAPQQRGIGQQLIEHFEQWAKEKGCHATAMIHLTDSMPEVLERFYRMRGYRLIEKHYLKEL